MKVLSKEEMQNCSAVEVLMKLRLYVILNESNNTIEVSSAELQWVIEKLMYIVCKTWLNIVFMNNNQFKLESHWHIDRTY